MICFVIVSLNLFTKVSCCVYICCDGSTEISIIIINKLAINLLPVHGNKMLLSVML